MTGKKLMENLSLQKKILHQNKFVFLQRHSTEGTAQKKLKQPHSLTTHTQAFSLPPFYSWTLDQTASNFIIRFQIYSLQL